MLEVIHEDDQVRTSLLGMLNEAALLSEELFQFQSVDSTSRAAPIILIFFTVRP